MELLTRLDVEIFLWIQNHLHSHVFDLYFALFRDKHTWIPLYVFLIAWLFFNFGKKAGWVILFAIALIAATDQINSSFIKKMIKRERPCRNEQLSEQYTPLIQCSGGYSFPSSHATNHMGLAVFLIFVVGTGRFRWLLMLWAILVGFSQVYVGVHFPLDVVCGFLEGALLAGVFFLLFKWFGQWKCNYETP